MTWEETIKSFKEQLEEEIEEKKEKQRKRKKRIIAQERGKQIEEKRKKTFKGIWIPKEICFIPNLNWQEKILLSEIKLLCDLNKGRCFTTNKYFADFLMVEKQTISNSISKLIKMGLIKSNLMRFWSLTTRSLKITNDDIF